MRLVSLALVSALVFGLTTTVLAVTINPGNVPIGPAPDQPLWTIPVEPNDIPCPPEGVPEGEPECHDQYLDIYNGGCFSTPTPQFQILPPGPEQIMICGASGTFMLDGITTRDTDWYQIAPDAPGFIEFSCQAEFPLQILLMDGGGGCDAYTILEWAQVNPLEYAFISFPLNPGLYWLWVGPTGFTGVPCGSDYIMTLDGYVSGGDTSSDLMVIGLNSPMPSIHPGGELVLDFSVVNNSPFPTTVTAIMNYIFIWDANLSVPETQLSPTDSHAAFLATIIGPGEIVVFNEIGVIIPADAPLDTTLTIAVVIDWLEVEPELDDTNNISLLDIPILPQPIPLNAEPVSAGDVIDIPFFGDVFELPANGLGNGIWAELYAAQSGSELDSHLSLSNVDTGEEIAADGYVPSIGTDSRVTVPNLPMSSSAFRFEISGEDSTIGPFELLVQETLPEAEPNNDILLANPIELERAVTGYLDMPGDVDFYSFIAELGSIVSIDIDSDQSLSSPADSTFDPFLTVWNQAGDLIWQNDDNDDNDPHLVFPIPDTGQYFLSVEDFPGEGQGRGFPDYPYQFRLGLLSIDPLMLPDLVALNIMPIDPVALGDSVSVEFEAWNVGATATFSGGVSIDVLLAEGDTVSEADSLIEVCDIEGYLAAGESNLIQKMIALPPWVIDGEYTLGIYMDPTHMETEADENNNLLTTTLFVALSDVEVDENPFPRVLALKPGGASPISGLARIEYHLPGGAGGGPVVWPVKLEVLDVSGRSVVTLVDEPKPSGIHVFNWRTSESAGPVSSGVYFFRLKAGPDTRTKRMVIVR